MLTDEISLYFENPPGDAFGHDHVSGKVRALDASVVVHWKVRDRTFKKSDEGDGLGTVELAYTEIESTEVRSRLWFRKDLVLRVKDPRKFADIPGADMGELVVRLEAGSRKAAGQFLKLVDFKLAEISANAFSDLLEDES